MLRPQGYLIVVGDYGVTEQETISCGHCNRIVMVKAGSASTVYSIPQKEGPPKEEPGAMCRICMRAVCLQCHDIGTCTPLEKWIEQSEAAGRKRKQMGL